MGADIPEQFKEAEAKVVSMTHATRQGELDLMTKMVNMYLQGFNTIGSYTPTEDNQTEHVWLRLVVRSFHSMRCAVWLTARGYYSHSMALLRIITEDWFLCHDCGRHRPTLESLVTGKRLRPWSDMAAAADAASVYHDDYVFESKFAHSTGLSLEVLVDPDTSTMRTAPTYDDVLFLTCCELFVRNAIRMAEFLERSLRRLACSKVNDWRRTAEPSLKECRLWLDTIRNNLTDVSD